MAGYKQNRRKGWLAFDNFLKKGTDLFNLELLSEYRILSSYLCGLKDCGKEVELMQEQNSNGDFKKRRNKFHPL